MFDNLAILLKKIIVKINKFTNNHNSSNNEPTTPVQKNKQLNKQINSRQNKKEIPNHPSFHKKNNQIKKTVKKTINKEGLSKKIKRNMFFLDELVIKLENNSSYISYYEKVVELRTQSEATYKILHRMSSDKPYYKKTLETIFKHTKIVSELLED